MILKNTHIPVFQKTKIQQKYMFERRFFKVLVSLGILSIFLYVFSLSSVIYGVVQRRTLEKEVAQVQAEIGALEANYLVRANELNYQEVALALYHTPKNIFYESKERVAFETTTTQRN